MKRLALAASIVGMLVCAVVTWQAGPRAIQAAAPDDRPGVTAAAGQRPVAAIQHALVISVDGLRPDLLLRANTPSLHALFARGSYTFWARTVPVAITLPSHTSMLTGDTVEHHGITFNDDGPAQQVYPNVPTLLEMAKQAGYSTALAAGKSKFAVLARPGSVDWSFIPPRGHGYSDAQVADAAIQMIQQHAPDVLFVHLGETDSAGHSSGWGSPQQITTIERADRDVGRILAALRQRDRIESTVIIATADHGGTGTWHGADDARARHVPWIISGPGIAPGVDLTTIRELQVDTQDTTATVCWLLGIPIDRPIDGKPVRQILQRTPELDASTTPASAISVPAR